DSEIVDQFQIMGIDFAADETGSFAPSPFDQAQIIEAALAAIGLDEPYAIIGASYGGMVALAYAERFQPIDTRLIIISADDRPHPNATGIRSLQRRIVDLGLRAGQPQEALAVARGLAMVGYRTPLEFRSRFTGGIEGTEPLSPSDVGNYLKARGL